jgi:glyoxylase-like metal-dependent hydrolase (beta-lactamase superfamily II)
MRTPKTVMRIATPQSWYETRTVGDGITHIHEPYIKAFYRCNIWHVRGREKDLLVDSGMGVVSLRQQVPLVTERPLLAVASHTHFDHVGCHHEFAERLVHRDEAELLARPTRAAEDGDVIDLGDRHFEVVHTPGHSPGEIMLWEAETAILFSGDTVYDGPLIDDAYHSDVAAYLASMKRILDLPVRVVHGGHFPSFDGGRYRALVRAYIDAKEAQA